MLLNAVNFNSLNTFKLSKTHTKPISFLANAQKDSFQKNTNIFKSDFANNVSAEAQNKLLEEINLIANNPERYSPLGYGMSGVV